MNINPQVIAQVTDDKTSDTGEQKMSAGSQAFNAYKSAEIKTLSQRELIIKLYEGADRFLLHAQAAIYNQEWEMSHEKCSKAKAIFMELLSTLNFENGGAIAGQLRDLYLFLISEIIESNLTKDAERLKKLHPIIHSLLSAWRDIPENLANSGGANGGDPGTTFNIRT
ncbi:MAG: flagellar export chaperone FliS [Planctomycetes bacterium]|nr:flagellar export chaperone FliS [Planctomycetota bacterium]